MKIKLLKLKTLEDAEYPQEEKYPSGEIITTGYMWKNTKPKIGEVCHIHSSKTYFHFQTSIVTEIIEDTKEHIIFKTLNSIYKIIIK